MPDKVLIIDDEPKEIFREILEPEGFTVYLADDGEEAFALMGAGPPDVVILDLIMPKISGEEFLNRLKEKGYLSKIGIIVMTGFNDFDFTRKRLTANFPIDAYLEKPVDSQELVEKVYLCLDKKKEREKQ